MPLDGATWNEISKILVIILYSHKTFYSNWARDQIILFLQLLGINYFLWRINVSIKDIVKYWLRGFTHLFNSLNLKYCGVYEDKLIVTPRIFNLLLMICRHWGVKPSNSVTRAAALIQRDDLSNTMVTLIITNRKQLCFSIFLEENDPALIKHTYICCMIILVVKWPSNPLL